MNLLTLSMMLLVINGLGVVIMFFIGTFAILCYDCLKSGQRLFYAVAIWPVTDQGFQNTKWPAVLYSQ